MLKTRTLGKGMSKWKRTDTKTREPQGRKGKGKKRTLETCLCCGKAGHKKADCKIKTATCSNCGKVGSLRAVCRNTRTHTRLKKMQMNPEVIVEAFWCMAVRDIVEDGHCNCTEKHDVSSEHRDESKLTEVPHPDESKFRKVIKNIETGQNSRKVITNIETGQNSRKVVESIEMGRDSGNDITNIETGQILGKWSRRSRWVNRIENEDRNQDMREFVQNELTDQKLQQETRRRIRDEVADG